MHTVRPPPPHIRTTRPPALLSWAGELLRCIILTFARRGMREGAWELGGEFLPLKRCVNVWIWLRLCASRKVTDPLRHEEESANRTSLGERVGGVGSYVSGARPEAGGAGYDRHCLLMAMSLPCTVYRSLPALNFLKFLCLKVHFTPFL